MSSVMKIDIASKKEFIIMGSIACTWLLISIIIGASGPNIHDSYQYFAYDCPHHSHNWSSYCEGIQMSQGISWVQTFPEVGLLNRFWALRVIPYTNNQTSFNGLPLQTEVTLLGHDPHEGTNIWYLLTVNETKTELISCDGEQTKCQSFIVAFEDFIKYPIYQIQIRFPDPSQRSWIGDVGFEFIMGHPGEARLEIGFHVTYLIISVCFTVFFFLRMKKIPLEDWNWEQRSISLLLISLIFYNNFFFPFTYATRGWFFPFMSSLLEVTFRSLILLFWILMADKLRREEIRFDFSLEHVPKLVAVTVYGILTLILFAWTSINLETDPIESNEISGIQVMFYIVIIAWIAIIVWIIVLSVLTLPIIRTKSYLMTRYLFFVVPTAVCILSNFISIFSGNLGPLKRSTLSFTYFSAMYNIYVYVFLWGYWPGRDSFSGESASNEESPLYYNFGSNERKF